MTRSLLPFQKFNDLPTVCFKEYRIEWLQLSFLWVHLKVFVHWEIRYLDGKAFIRESRNTYILQIRGGHLLFTDCKVHCFRKSDKTSLLSNESLWLIWTLGKKGLHSFLVYNITKISAIPSKLATRLGQKWLRVLFTLSLKVLADWWQHFFVTVNILQIWKQQ